jgi:hypothetical protein
MDAAAKIAHCPAVSAKALNIERLRPVELGYFD